MSVGMSEKNLRQPRIMRVRFGGERERNRLMKRIPAVFETGEAAHQLTIVCSSACPFGERAANKGCKFKIAAAPVGYSRGRAYWITITRWSK